MLTFEPATHTYRYGEKKICSVTEVLGQWLLPPGASYYVNTFTGESVPADTFEAARVMGSAIHVGAAYILKGQGLNWDTLAPELVEPFRQLEAWIKMFRVE